MNKRVWLFALLLIPLALAIPLYSAASWRPRAVGVHPFATIIKRKTSPPVRLVTTLVWPDLMMAPDGKLLLSFSRGGLRGAARGLAMWDVNHEKMLWKKQQQGALDWMPLCFSPDGQTLVMARNPEPSCCAGHVAPGLAFFDAQTGTQKQALGLKQFAYRFDSATFAPDAKQLATATNSGVQLWNVAGQRMTHVFNEHALVGAPKRGYQLNVEFSRDAQSLALLWGDWQSQRKGSRLQLAFYDLKGGLKWKTRANAPAKIEFSPDKRWLLLSALHAPTFEIYEIATGQLMWKKSVTGGRAGDGLAVWMPDSSAVVLVNSDQFEWLDARTGRLLRRLSRLKISEQKFALAPDGNYIYGINADGKIQSQRLS